MHKHILSTLLTAALGISIPVYAVRADRTDIQVVSHYVTSGQNLQHSKKVPMKVFSSQDSVNFFANFQWDPRKMSLGKHTVTWNWFSGSTLVSTTTKQMEFHHPPYSLWSRREASALGKGEFTVQVAMDGTVMASSGFSIKN
jgi:hypothetical protein